MSPDSGPTYRPSGRIAPIRFTIWFLVAAAWSLFVGYLLCKAFHNGIYVRILAPIIAGLLVAVAAFAVGYFGHCRNRGLGVLVGFLLGAGMYLSYYQFDFAHLAGFRNVYRVDMLPMWIQVRVLTDVDVEVGRGGPNGPVAVGPRNRVDEAFRWVMFTMEGLLAALPAAGAGWMASSAPYSERHRRWMATHKQRCAAGAGLEMAEAILAGEPTDRVAGLFQAGRPTDQTYDELQIDYALNEPDSPVYLSVIRGMVGDKKQKKTPSQKSLIHRRILTAEEAAVLAGAIAIPHAKFGPDDGRPRPGDRTTDRPAGRTFELPDDQAGKIITSGMKYRVTAVQLAPLVLGLAGAIGLGVLAYLNWDNWDIIPRVAAIVGAGGVLLVALLYLLRYEHALPAMIWLRQTRAVIQARPDPVVEADDPDAVFVEVIPRANWHRLMVQNASDIGLFAIDTRRRVLLFEGDKERWAIPAESVISCEVEEFTELGQEENKYNLHAVVVLTANVDGRTWEAPLCPRPTGFAPWRGPERRRLTAELLDRIRPVLGPAQNRAG